MNCLQVLSVGGRENELCRPGHEFQLYQVIAESQLPYLKMGILILISKGCNKDSMRLHLLEPGTFHVACSSHWVNISSVFSPSSPNIGEVDWPGMTWGTQGNNHLPPLLLQPFISVLLLCQASFQNLINEHTTHINSNHIRLLGAQSGITA